MKILLRSTETGLYFLGPDKWTSNPAKGFDFRFIDRALNFIETWDLKEVELAFSFDNPPSITPVSLEKTALRYSAV